MRSDAWQDAIHHERLPEMDDAALAEFQSLSNNPTTYTCEKNTLTESAT